MDITLKVVVIGIGATLIMDIWAILQKQFFNIPSLDYRLVGRWLGHFPQGQFIHHTIIQAPKVKGEFLMGWLAHYAIGIIFAFLLVAVVGHQWVYEPTLIPAFIIGIISVIAPFCIMQPAFGFGIAASRTPQPNVARRRSLIAHASFGIGLYLSAQFLQLIINL
ncbi:conserved membrane protein of unknown function [Xenorhabdus poinarii G6]|uniref:DUF2938 domain-containing protein n=1 Tax=Xenorhabdus poinarii G6 TaxID=1354304 RepID=A0A068R507_9GAMM|nr:DUF2938 domain-containing protein [Xenorhabdus poinarii]CDG22124.1 conserved membrane protein of unknown function [Xenorhabdus poinarii G6]